MIDDNLLDELVAEIGALIIENQNLRRKIDAIRFEVDTLNERVASTDMTLEALMRNAAILRAALSESRSNAVQLSAEKAQQDSADSAQRRSDASYGDRPQAT